METHILFCNLLFFRENPSFSGKCFYSFCVSLASKCFQPQNFMPRSWRKSPFQGLQANDITSLDGHVLTSHQFLSFHLGQSNFYQSKNNKLLLLYQKHSPTSSPLLVASVDENSTSLEKKGWYSNLILMAFLIVSGRFFFLPTSDNRLYMN